MTVTALPTSPAAPPLGHRVWNAVRLHAGMNPDFFAGTIVEKPAAEALRKESGNQRAVKR